MSHSSIEELIVLLSKLPGIGPKSAERIAYYLLQTNKDYIHKLTDKIIYVKEKVKPCKECGNYSETDICPICQDADRDKTRICVIEEAKDIFIIEKLKVYKGLYHVLFGSISPINGIGPEDLNIAALLKRVRNYGPPVEEVIIATNPTPEGDTTGIYIAKLLKPFSIKVTRIAYGIPVGANIDYTDLVTLAHSFVDRKAVE